METSAERPTRRNTTERFLGLHFVAAISSRDFGVIICNELSGTAVNLHKILLQKRKGGTIVAREGEMEGMSGVVREKERKERAMAGGLIVKPAASPVP